MPDLPAWWFAFDWTAATPACLDERRLAGFYWGSYPGGERPRPTVAAIRAALLTQGRFAFTPAVGLGGARRPLPFPALTAFPCRRFGGGGRPALPGVHFRLLCPADGAYCRGPQAAAAGVAAAALQRQARGAGRANRVAVGGRELHPHVLAAWAALGLGRADPTLLGADYCAEPEYWQAAAVAADQFAADPIRSVGLRLLAAVVPTRLEDLADVPYVLVRPRPDGRPYTARDLDLTAVAAPGPWRPAP
jgi:hypothetical protein